MDDIRYAEIVDYLSTGQYPKSLTELPDLENRKKAKRQIRSQATPFTTEDGMLYYKGCRVLRRNEVSSVIKRMHEGPYTGGHLGRDKTLSKVSSNYYWKGMKNDVINYIRNCDACCRVNPNTRLTAPELHPIPVPSRVWSLVGIDIIGPFHATVKGNKYIVAATDHFSKWSEAAAIPNKSAKEVAKFLLEVISRLGPMESLISDQGREFVNTVIDHVTSALDIEHIISSPYHPETNGQRERDNRTLKSMLTKHARSKDSWDEVLQGVLFAYRISVHASTHCSPFEVMYNRKPRIAKGPLPAFQPNQASSQQILEEMRKECDSRNKTVADNISKAQSRQKKNFDARFRTNVFPTGSRVLIKNAKKIRRFGDKLTPMWIGPYLVVEDMGKGRVRLQNLDSKKLLSNVYNCKNLKEYTVNSATAKKTPTRTPLKLKKPHTTHQARFAARCPPVSSPTSSNFPPPTKPSKHSTTAASSKPGATKDPATSQSPAPIPFHPPSIRDCQKLAKKMRLKFSAAPNYLRTSATATDPVKIHQTKGDGNCFFRSIAYAVTGSENGHKQVRDSTVSHMSSKTISAKLEGYLSQNVSDYLNKSSMASDGQWATDAEIMGVASLLNMDIYVYCKTGHSSTGLPTFNWARYPKDFTLTSKCSNTALCLTNLDEHYNVVINV